jgi:hypothetical protein
MIRVLYGYQGTPSKERYIPPGKYKRNARALCGLADYLVENGHAVLIADEQPEPKHEGPKKT